MQSSALLLATLLWATLAFASAPLADGKSYLAASGSRHLDEEEASVGALMRQKRESPTAPNSTTRSSSSSSGNKKKTKHGKVKQRVFEIECLAAHNKWRRLHSAKDLSFDKKIAAFAQKRADYIAASDGAEFKHPPDLPYGENLAWHSTETTNCHDLVKMWYDEVDMYDFNNPSFDAQTGHFTQLVWRSTERVGCARAVSDGPKGGVTLVCNYDPAGNYLGEFKENVVRAPKKVPHSGKPTSNTTTATTTMTTMTMKMTTTTEATPTTTTSVATTTTTSRRNSSKPATGSATAAPAAVNVTSTASSGGITTTAPSLSESANQEKKKDESNPKRKKGNKNKKKKKKNKNKKKKKKNQSAVTTTPPALTAQTTTTVAPAASG